MIKASFHHNQQKSANSFLFVAIVGYYDLLWLDVHVHVSLCKLCHMQTKDVCVTLGRQDSADTAKRLFEVCGRALSI